MGVLYDGEYCVLGKEVSEAGGTIDVLFEYLETYNAAKAIKWRYGNRAS